MMNRFVRIRKELIRVNNEEKRELPIDSRKKVKRREKYASMSNVVNVICKCWQKCSNTLAACQDDLNVLLDTLSDMKEDRNSVFYRCRMNRRYISEKSSIFLYHDFEPGVAKIQSGKSKELKRAKKLL